LLEIEEVRERLKQLDESDAKSFLMLIYAGLDTALTGTGGDEALKKIVKNLYDMYSRLPDNNDFKKNKTFCTSGAFVTYGMILVGGKYTSFS
jgi:hypothetical protein